MVSTTKSVSQKDVLKCLARAMREPDSFVCRIVYRDEEGVVTDRYISPFRMLGGNKQVEAQCLSREELRKFNVSRILDIRTVDANDIEPPMPLEVIEDFGGGSEDGGEVRYFDSPAVSRSDLSLFNESRRMFRAVKDGDLDYPSDLDGPSSEDILLLGTAAHLMLLEPEKIGEIVVFDGASRSGKVWDKFREQNAGKVILTVKQFIHAMVMAEAGRHVAGKLLQELTKCEEWIEWEKVVDGDSIKMKARLDAVWPVGKRIVVADVKTTPDADGGKFRSSVKRYCYWLQDAHYSEAAAEHYGVDIEDVDFVFIALGKSQSEKLAKACLHLWDEADDFEGMREQISRRVESLAPLICRLHRLGQSDRARARSRRAQIIREYIGCLESGDWSDSGENEVSELEGVV